MNDVEPKLLDRVLWQLNTRRARRIIAVVCLLIAAFAFWKIYKPAADKKDKLLDDAAQIQKKTSSQQAELDTLVTQLRKGGKGFSRDLATALPTEILEDRQFELLSRLAEATDVNVPNFEPGTAAASGDYQRVPLNLQVNCKLENCLRFLNGLNRMVQSKGDRLTAIGPVWFVDDISLGQAEDGMMSMTLTSGIFLAAPPAPAASAAGDAGAASTPDPAAPVS